MADAPSSIRVVSLNCWGLKYLATHRHARLTEIGAQLAQADPAPEIVGLQECWTQQDFDAICALTKHILPHAKFYYSGIFGGGLAILSRWPIIESTMYRYPLNGRPTAFFRGDWFVGKGVACASIRYGSGTKDVAEVFCTHLHAPYEREPRDSYLCHRTAQAYEIAKLMRAGAARGHLVLGLGDFNMIPSSLAHRLIETHGHVHDVWRLVHPDSAVCAARDVPDLPASAMPTVAFNIAKNGTTCDSKTNTWRWEKAEQKRLDKGVQTHVPDDTPDPNAKRLDYIFVGNGAGQDREWAPASVNVGMTSRHPTLLCSLSDHFSVETTLVRRGDNTAAALVTQESAFSKPPSRALDYNEILTMIDVYEEREQRQRRLRLGHFVVSLFVSIGCLVAVWWSPRNFVAFLLMLLSTLGLSAGVIDGLIGGLFVGSELRALWEFRWEMENAQRRDAEGKETRGTVTQ